MAKEGFITEDFLLDSEPAERLYHDYAAKMPIIDFHCHLPPAEIAEDKRWSNISEVWLHHDHYKWRTMRSNGVDEKYCTGDGSDRGKFEKFAETMPYLLRNPMYDWCHLELKQYFGITDRLLNAETAGEIYDRCSETMKEDWFSARGLIKQSNVIALCTTDDPAVTLEHHRAIADDESFDTLVLPTWRPDRATDVSSPVEFNTWTDDLSEISGVEISSLDTFMDAICKRQDDFHDIGCRLSDHGMETVPSGDCSRAEAKKIFAKVRGGDSANDEEINCFAAYMLRELCLLNHEKGWVQQFHIGAMRNNNLRILKEYGKDAGCDSISDLPVAQPLSRLMGELDESNRLAATILYNLNPRDNELLVSLMGNFQSGPRPGKIQYGAAWWFLDQKDGMKRQIEVLSMLGLLRRFVGMVTDSRSFLSYPRHEYFRRLLCNIIGGDIAAGNMPQDMDLAGKMVQEIICLNAADYFGFNLEVPAS